MQRAVLSLLLLAGAHALRSDPQPGLREPLDVNRVYASGQDGAGLQALPVEAVKLAGKGQERTASFPGGRSVLRFREGAVPALVVRFAAGGVGASAPRLYLLQSGPQERMVRPGIWAYSSAQRQSPGTVPSRLEGYGKVSYRIVPPPILRPGEYAIGLGRGSFGFTFGIDPK
ncbi:hypothetical protein [Paludibaculum fermentans]|uniref:hypothetical protein n=1 Tax=Paludibaculum fermentans TaxID=1473598 RepID=UPI003EBC6D0F